MTNPLSATYRIDLFRLAPPDAPAPPQGSRIVAASKGVVRRASDFIAARQRLARSFNAALAAERNGTLASAGDPGGEMLKAADQMTLAWDKLTECVGRRPTNGGLTREDLPSWEASRPGNWELQHLIDKHNEFAHTADPLIPADVRQQILADSGQRIAQLLAPRPVAARGPGQRIRHIARRALLVIRKCMRALRKVLPFTTRTPVAPASACPADEPRTREDIQSALVQNRPVSPGPGRMRARQASSESLKFEDELRGLEAQDGRGRRWLERAAGLAGDLLAPAHVRAQTHLLIARTHYDAALAADQRRADEVKAGRDVAALGHIEIANGKTTAAAHSLVQMLKLDATLRLRLTDPMRPLLDLVQAAHADLRLARYGMHAGTVFEDTPDIVGSAQRLAALGLMSTPTHQDGS